jgi:hypothetical protein
MNVRNGQKAIIREVRHAAKSSRRQYSFSASPIALQFT